jgi:hypothetical protein
MFVFLHQVHGLHFFALLICLFVCCLLYKEEIGQVKAYSGSDTFALLFSNYIDNAEQ